MKFSGLTIVAPRRPSSRATSPPAKPPPITSTPPRAVRTERFSQASSELTELIAVITTPNLNQLCRQARKEAHAWKDPLAARTARRGGRVGCRRFDEGRETLAGRVLDAPRGVQPADPEVPGDPGWGRHQLQPVLCRLR